jgi:hypothetical protein
MPADNGAILAWVLGQGFFALLFFALIWKWLFTPAYVQLMREQLDRALKQNEKLEAALFQKTAREEANARLLENIADTLKRDLYRDRGD